MIEFFKLPINLILINNKSQKCQLSLSVRFNNLSHPLLSFNIVNRQMEVDHSV